MSTGAGLRVCGGRAVRGHDGMASRLVSPDRCRVSCGPGGGSGTRPAGPGRRQAAPQASLTRRPASSMMAGPGGTGRKTCRGCYAVMGCPMVLLCSVAACWLRPSLRVCPGLAGRGAWGVPRLQGPGGASHNLVRAAPVTRGAGGGGHATRRPRARPGRQLTLPGGWRGGRARRASRRTPGSARSGRRRSWRCSGRLSRGGR